MGALEAKKINLPMVVGAFKHVIHHGDQANLGRHVDIARG